LKERLITKTKERIIMNSSKMCPLKKSTKLVRCRRSLRGSIFIILKKKRRREGIVAMRRTLLINKKTQLSQ